MNNALKALVAYLKDWKNLLTHGLIGVGLVVLAVFLPVHPLIRIGILIAVVAFNIVRGKLAKSRKARRHP